MSADEKYVQRIYAPVTMEGSEGLLAVIVHAGYSKPGVTFFTDEEQPLQLACLEHREGAVIPAHKHIKNPRKIEQTQEVLFVVEGPVDLTIYTSAGEQVTTTMLFPGDICLLMKGGHKLEMTYGPAKLFEAKTGPYYGREKDKVAI